MAYEAKDFSGLLGMEGLSDGLLKNHFKLYQGYVANTEKLAAALAAMAEESKTGTPEYAELKRRFGWEFNGMRLHELYFGNLEKGGTEADADSTLAKTIRQSFGSPEAWEKDFRACGAMRGIGWVVLYYDAAAGRLFNCWVNEHDAGHLSGCAPILVMDVFEHAFIADYGLNRADYIAAFLKNVGWAEAESRFRKASS